MKSHNTLCGAVIIFKAANDCVCVRVSRAGAVTAEYSQSPTLGPENAIAIAHQCCDFLSLYKFYVGNAK